MEPMDGWVIREFVTGLTRRTIKVSFLPAVNDDIDAIVERFLDAGWGERTVDDRHQVELFTKLSELFEVDDGTERIARSLAVQQLRTTQTPALSTDICERRSLLVARLRSR